jgi:hypothetical protein
MLSMQGFLTAVKFMKDFLMFTSSESLLGDLLLAKSGSS